MTLTVTAPQPNNAYLQRFRDLRDELHGTTANNGYFHPANVPYHSVETLICEAPDHGHETTSETFSYWAWLEAMHGNLTGDWTPLQQVFTSMEANIIPTAADQPTNSFYNAADPADYAPEADLPSGYPSRRSTRARPSAAIPIAAELQHDLRHAEHLRHALDPRRRQLLRLRAAGRRHLAAVVHQHVPARAAGVRLGDGAAAVVGGLPVGPGDERRLPAALHHGPDARAAVALHERARRRRPADPGDVLGEDVRRRARRQRDGRHARRQGRDDGRLPPLRDVRQVLQDDGLHQPQLPGRHRLQRGALPDVLVLRVGRRHRRVGRLGLAHRLQPQPLRLPEPDGRARAHHGARAAAALHERRARLDDEPRAPARVLPLAAVGGRRHRGRRHQQLGRPLRGAAGRRLRPSTGCSTRRTRCTWTRAATPGSASRPGRSSAWPSTTT